MFNFDKSIALYSNDPCSGISCASLGFFHGFSDCWDEYFQVCKEIECYMLDSRGPSFLGSHIL